MELGNLAQWVGAVATSFAVIVALSKDEILRLIKRPKLVGLIKAEYPYCVKTPAHETSPEVWNGFRYWIRIMVKNEGGARADKVEVFLSKFAVEQTNELVAKFMPMNLQWSYINNIYADGISPEMSRLCDLAAISDPGCPSFKRDRPPGISENQTCLSLRLEALPPRHDWLPPGRYQFEVMIAASNCKPVVQKFRLHLTGLWSDDEETMLTNGIVLS